MAEAHGEKYEAFESLEAARAAEDGVVIFEADYGGQIYLVCPARLIQCSESRLKSLLLELDAHGWREPEGAKVVYEKHSIGSVIPAGMGGGLVTNRVWLHRDLEKLLLRPPVEEALAGIRERLR